MSANSACTIQDGSAGAVNATGTVTVTPTNNVTIALTNTGNVRSWTVKCTYSDYPALQTVSFTSSASFTYVFPAPSVPFNANFVSLADDGSGVIVPVSWIVSATTASAVASGSTYTVKVGGATVIQMAQAASDFVGPGNGTLATAGLFRTPLSSVVLAARDSGGTGYCSLMRVGASNDVYIGDATAGNNVVIGNLNLNGANFTYNYNGTTQILSMNNFRAAWAVGHRRAVSIKANTNATLGGFEDVVLCSTLSAARTFTLPSAPTTGDWYEFGDSDGTITGTNTLTIAGNGKNINGAASQVLNAAFAKLGIVYNGTQWTIIHT